MADPDTARTLKVIPADGGEPRSLLTIRSSRGILGYPECFFDSIIIPWTSDSRHVLAVLDENTSEEQQSSSGLCRLYKVPVDGGEPVFVGAIPKPGTPWVLSPDDSRLALHLGEYRGEIWILEGLDRR